MFMQIITAKVKDEQAARASFERWGTDLLPGATGFLGSTAGIGADGTLVALARFESEQAAQANSDRPEQGAWWSEVEGALDGEATFQDSTDVTMWLDGGSDEAGFVQVMMGRSPDIGKLREVSEAGVEQLREVRPEIIGGTFAVVGEDGYVQTAYFTSESEARSSESAGPPPEVEAMIEERMQLMGDVTYHDLHDPIFISAT